MPLDFGLLGGTPRINTPFDALKDILAIRNQQEAAAGLREQRASIAAQRQEQTDKLARENKQREDASKAIQQGGGVRAQTLEWALKSAPDTVQSLTEFFDKADKSAAELKKLKQDASNLEADWLGDVAEGIKKHGSTPEAIKTGLSYALEQFPDYAEGAKRIEAQLQGAAPEQVNAFLDQVIAQSPSRRQKPQQAPMTVSKGTGVLNPATGKYEVPVPDTPTGGSFEDYLSRYATERGIPPQAVTSGVIEAARKKYAQADDRPQDPVARELAALRLADAKRDAELRGKGREMPVPFQSVIGRVLVNAPATRRKSIEQDFARVWASGNEDELKDQIRNAAIQTENVDTKNQVTGRMATKASLDDTVKILEEMKAKGVPTGFFTGTVEDLARRVGSTTNPEYVALANRLQGTLINYRRAATGAAFGEREGSAYEKMFPNYKNNLPVNLALIKGLQREMQTYDDVYWESKLGKDGKALVFGKSGASKDPMGIR